MIGSEIRFHPDLSVIAISEWKFAVSFTGPFIMMKRVYDPLPAPFHDENAYPLAALA
jgi:hypothetical protein